MEKISPDSTWNEEQTTAQVVRITRLAIINKIVEPIEEQKRSRLEAKNLINELRLRLRLKIR